MQHNSKHKMNVVVPVNNRGMTPGVIHIQVDRHHFEFRANAIMDL
jgi:hypothetical protein